MDAGTAFAATAFCFDPLIRAAGPILNVDPVPVRALVCLRSGAGDSCHHAAGLHDADIGHAAAVDKLSRLAAQAIPEKSAVESFKRVTGGIAQCVTALDIE
jgi:hypothetical protein